MNQKTSTLSPDDGLFKLAGDDPSWIWVHTCPTPRCSCREAVVLATHEGREALVARGSPVRQAWMAEEGHYREIARTCEGLIAFELDIDTAQVLHPEHGEPLDLAQHSDVAAIMARIDGELLDAIGHLWYRGKGMPDPVKAALAAPRKIGGWQRGEQLGWHEVYDDVRQDLYALDDHVYEAWDFYCPIPCCACGEVTLHFDPVFPADASSLGHVNVHLAGSSRLEPEAAGDRTRLAQLWAALERYPFCGRHELAFESYPRPVGGSPVTTTTSAGGG